MNGLILHCGAHTASREAVLAVATPAPTATWRPIPHGDLLAGVQTTLERGGLRTVEEAHGLTRDGQRYFGLLRVQNGAPDGDFGLVVGVRNSHDKSFPAGLVVGAAVFVCDNLSFSGEVRLARKHTVHIARDLPELIEVAVGKIGALRATQAKRFDAYRQTEFADAQAHDLLVRAVDARVLPVTHLPDVLSEWRAPRHPEFAASGKTCWRLFQAFTEAIKGNLDALPRRTLALHGMLDTACGLVISTAAEPQAATAA
jgi:hypothetical protein